MRWSLTIGRIFGITFRIHITFFLLLLLIFMSGSAHGGPAAGFAGVLFICAVFACVLIHEIAHSLIAKRFGKQAKSITLLPIGGVAAMDEMPEKPVHEILMSIGGPFINIAIALVLFILAGFQVQTTWPNMYPATAGEFISGLIMVNIFLAAFNLLPAFPLDGGRVLRAFLALHMDYVRATSTAVFVGEVLAMLMIFYGILANWWLILIGFFIYIAAEGEKQHVVVRAVLHRATADDAASTDFKTLDISDTVAEALQIFYHGCQDDFPVMDGGTIRGILTRNRIVAAINENKLETSVSEVMDQEFMKVDPGTPLDVLHRQMLSAQKSAAVVEENGRLTGLVCIGNLERYFAINSAIRKKENVLGLKSSFRPDEPRAW